MQLLRFLLAWVRRIPVSFIIPFVVLMLTYLGVVTVGVRVSRATTIGDLAWKVMVVVGFPAWLRDIAFVKIFWEGIVAVVLVLLGALLAYNLSASIYSRIRPEPEWGEAKPTAAVPGKGTRLDAFERIGIILAGGGAKGAYQAGAMKAIYEFLEENNALGKVRMVAGTSIGSWNGMFWLSGLIKSPGPTEMSAHERWWRTISLEKIVVFDTFVPLRCNHFLLATPWEDTFQQIFAESSQVRNRLEQLFVTPGSAQDLKIHFYFTRSNVARGRLEFSTNWPGIRDLKRRALQVTTPDAMEPVVQTGSYEVIEKESKGGFDEVLWRTKRAVFASMDLPPVFPYTKVKIDVDEWFEDGGVVDNLPIWFGTQIESCDLLFVLPLNATFAEPVNQTSVTKRVYRVMDVRQGVLERNAFKLAYLYNELAALRNAQSTVETPIRQLPQPEARLQARALSRRHKPVSIFAICPQRPLAIDTAEFWKRGEAGEAFDRMYSATKSELQDRFEQDTNPEWIRMTLVSPEGERSYFDDF